MWKKYKCLIKIKLNFIKKYQNKSKKYFTILKICYTFAI